MLAALLGSLVPRDLQDQGLRDLMLTVMSDALSVMAVSPERPLCSGMPTSCTNGDCQSWAFCEDPRTADTSCGAVPGERRTAERCYYYAY